MCMGCHSNSSNQGLTVAWLGRAWHWPPEAGMAVSQAGSPRWLSEGPRSWPGLPRRGGLRARCPSEAGGLGWPLRQQLGTSMSRGPQHGPSGHQACLVPPPFCCGFRQLLTGPSVWFTASTDLPLHSGLTAAPAAWGLEPGEAMQLPVGWKCTEGPMRRHPEAGLEEESVGSSPEPSRTG